MVRFLEKQEIKEIELVVASSIGADLAMAFVTNAKIPVKHIFFDGGQFAQIGKVTRRIMVPFLYVAMKSLYWSNGKTLKKIMWCDDNKIKPYFIKAGKNLTYRNLRRQLTDSLEDKPFPKLPEELQKHTFWEFGSKEEHFKYRSAVMQTYIYGNFPVFEGFNHMQYQIRDPEGFARMLETIMETDRLPKLTFAMASKVRKPGAVLIMGTITALLYFVTGQFTVLLLITFAIACILSELYRAVTKYDNSFTHMMISFVFFCYGMLGSPLAIWVYKDSFLAQIQQNGMSAEYVQSLSGLISTPMLIVLCISPVIGGVIGALIAKGLFRKHFKKAGIV